jgi:glycerol-3-phosphate acyltransferase PlsY
MELLLFILYWILFLFVASVPFDIFLPWVSRKFRDIESQLDTKKANIRFSKRNLVFFLNVMCQFGKGYLAVYFTAEYFASDLLFLVAITTVFVAHNWSVFLKFKNRKKIFLLLWGIYSAINPTFFIVFPISYILISLISNSFIIGSMGSVIFMFGAIWYHNMELVIFPANFVIFIVAFLVYCRALFKHFEEEPYTILNSFENR